MKYKSFFASLFLYIILAPSIIGQIDSTKARKISIGFAVSNNGQVDHSINDFYRQDSEFLNFLFNSPTSKQTELKYNFLFSYTSEKKIMYEIKLGYQSIINNYKTSNYSTEIDAKGSQSIYNINPSVGYLMGNKKVEFVLGLQLPIFIIGDYNFNDTEESYRGNSAGVRELQYISKTNTHINGGYIIGLNSFLNVKYLFKNRFFISSEIATGVLYASTGKTFSTETSTTYYGTYYPGYPPYYTSSDSDYSLKKTYFSSPEFSLGIGLKF